MRTNSIPHRLSCCQRGDNGPALTARKCSQGWYTCMKLWHGVTGCLVYMYCEAMADLCIRDCLIILGAATFNPCQLLLPRRQYERHFLFDSFRTRTQSLFKCHTSARRSSRKPLLYYDLSSYKDLSLGCGNSGSLPADQVDKHSFHTGSPNDNCDKDASWDYSICH